MIIPLDEQAAHLERIAEEIGMDPKLAAAIKTLRLMAEFPDEVREAIRSSRAKQRALSDPAVRLVMEAFPDAEVSVRDREDA